MSAQTIPASSPARFSVIDAVGRSPQLRCNYQLNQSGGAYMLYSNKAFKQIPEGGDPFGIVHQVVALASLRDSGVVSVRVDSHEIGIIFSVAPDDSAEIFRRALRRAGFQATF